MRSTPVRTALMMMLGAFVLASATVALAAPPSRCATVAPVTKTAATAQHVQNAQHLQGAQQVLASPHAGAGVAIVPFAVPVAVPVATVAQPAIFYGYSPYAEAAAYDGSKQSARQLSNATPQTNRAAPSAFGTSPDREEYQDEAPQDEETPSRKSGSLVARHCAACHQGAAARGGFVLSTLDDLSPAARLESIRRVLSHNARERMPRGRPLSSETMAALVRELSAFVDETSAE